MFSTVNVTWHQTWRSRMNFTGTEFSFPPRGCLFSKESPPGGAPKVVVTRYYVSPKIWILRGSIHPSHRSENSSSVRVCLKESREFSRPRTARLSLAPADPSAKTQEKPAETARSLNTSCSLLVFGGTLFLFFFLAMLHWCSQFCSCLLFLVFLGEF